MKSELILGYHKIAFTPGDPFEICVGEDFLEEQLEVISINANPITLQQLVRSFKNIDITKRSVVITYDDGYSEIFYSSKPICT